ncbi:MAG TPA: dihydrofolate reductase [Gammaproteobacteria bacterium]|nr:dihydrofolate reductase [Gammaproteobacteria bacterium]
MTHDTRTAPPLALVVAMGAEREIGHDGKMPWHLPADLKHFKAVTMGHTILMGRRTFESIGRPLPGRDNFVVSRDVSFQPDGCRVFASIDLALAAAPADQMLMVIGGATLYEVLLPQAQRIYLTRIKASFPADTWFPALDDDAWREVECEEHGPDEKNLYRYSFATLERVKGKGKKVKGER